MILYKVYSETSPAPLRTFSNHYAALVHCVLLERTTGIPHYTIGERRLELCYTSPL